MGRSVDYHARLYDPHLGRFTQPDTIVPEPFNPQSFNRFSYVINNPVKYIDPTEHNLQQTGPNSYQVNVFAAHEPAPTYTYSGGALPHSGPTYNDYNPTSPASMNLVSGGNTNWPATTPTSGGRRKGSGQRNNGEEVIVAKNRTNTVPRPNLSQDSRVGNAFELPTYLGKCW